jgi:GGDEF domain-containing protein
VRLIRVTPERTPPQRGGLDPSCGHEGPPNLRGRSDPPTAAKFPNLRMHESADGPEPSHSDSGLVPKLALDWLRAVVDDTATDEAESSAEADRPRERTVLVRERVGSASAEDRPATRDPFDLAGRYKRGQVDHAIWYRDWHLRWRMLQLPDRLHRFETELMAARTDAQVFATLTEHAVQIVGGYTCVLYPPGDGPRRPIPNPALRVDAGRITLTLPLEEVGLLARDRVLSDPDGRYAALAPLFSEEHAVSVAHAPFGEGGVILLIERRHERVFGTEDWDLLRLLSARAAAALMRVRLGTQIGEMRDTDPVTALPEASRLDAILAHARDLIASGEMLSLVGLRLGGLGELAREDGPAAAARARRTVADVLREVAGSLGLAAHRGNDEYVLLLPRLSCARAEHMVARVARQLPSGIEVRARMVAIETAGSPADLLDALDRAPERAWADRAIPTAG